MSVFKRTLTTCALVLLFALGRMTSDVAGIVAQDASADRASASQSAGEVARAEVQPAADPRPVYKVATREAFMDAVGSDRIVEIVVTEIDLSPFPTVAQEAYSGARYVRNSHSHDSDEPFAVQIANVKNLLIRGQRPQSRLLTSQAGADVLRFLRCSNVTLENLFIAHKTGWECTAGVVILRECDGFSATNCTFNGCGTVALDLAWCIGLRFERCVFENCSVSLLDAEYVLNLLLESCIFRDFGHGYAHGLAVELTRSTATFAACEFYDLEVIKKGRRSYGVACLFQLNDVYSRRDRPAHCANHPAWGSASDVAATKLVLSEAIFHDLQADTFVDNPECIEVVGATFERCVWVAEAPKLDD